MALIHAVPQRRGARDRRRRLHRLGRLRHLLAETEAFVVNIDKLTYAANLDSIPQAAGNPRYRFAQADICNGPALRQLFEQYQPALCHASGRRKPRRSIDRRPGRIHPDQHRRHLHAAAGGAATIGASSTRGAQGRFRFHHVSTDEVYGSLGAEGLFTETSALRAEFALLGLQGVVRSSGARLARRPTACRRSSPTAPTITGPIIFPRSSSRSSSSTASRSKPLPVYGDGGNVRDWLHVEDHARALTLVLERGAVGETYNVGGAQRAQQYRGGAGDLRSPRRDRARSPAGPRARLIASSPTGPATTGATRSTPSKIERELGWRAAETFESGLRKTVRWYVDNRSWWQPILDRGYRAERIGLARGMEAPARS